VDDYRRDNRGADLRDSLPSRNVVSLSEKQGERQVTRIVDERRDSGRNEPVLNSNNNDWKADREKFAASNLVQEGVVKDYGRRDDRSRNFPAVDANHLRPHVDFKHRDGGRDERQNNNFRNRGPIDDAQGRPPPNRKPLVPLKPIDRKKRCPFLMRVFLSRGNHNEIASFQNGSVPKEEIDIYAWQDTKLKEVAQLVKENYPDADKPETVLKFSRVYPDTKTGDWTIVELGRSGIRLGNDDYKNLYELGFSIGDFMDVAILNNRK
jgi:histone deacetylase complex subunit SAP18